MDYANIKQQSIRNSKELSSKIKMKCVFEGEGMFQDCKVVSLIKLIWNT